MALPSISPPPVLAETSVLQPQVPLQWWKASEEWSGVTERGQDVCLRLVRNSMDDEVEGNNAVVDLAFVLVHSDHLMECCHYFRDMTETFAANPSPTTDLHEVTLLVDGDDVTPYIECFRLMYNPPQAGSQLFKPSDSAKNNPKIEDVKYGLRLLNASSHIGYDALSTSVCDHLMDLSVHFCKEILVLAESQLREEGLSYLIMAYCHSQFECITYQIVVLMKKVRSQQWSPTPTSTFEWRVVDIVQKELERLLVEAHNECGGESEHDELPSPSEKMDKIRAMLKKACDLLKVLLMGEVGSEGVKLLLQNSWIHKLLDREVNLLLDIKLRLGREERDDPFYKAITTTVAKVYKEVSDRHVIVGNSDRHTLLKDWTFFMESLRNPEARRGPWVQYENAKKAIFGSLPHKMQMELLVMEGDRRVFVTFGSPEELSKFLKGSMAIR